MRLFVFGGIFWVLGNSVAAQELSRAELFRQQDPSGGIMALTAISVVFTALLCCFLIFKGIGVAFRWLTAPRVREAAIETEVVPEQEVSGDVYAAIAVAIYRYSRDLHDVENTVLTINRGAKAYSPWSSKIYGLRQFPK